MLRACADLLSPTMLFVGMDSALLIHRLHFAFTITFHYLFPQLTMGLALLIVVLKTIALKTGDEHYNHAARFWAKIFAINFAMGVVTGIPMEFQFGTNWSRFSKAAGGVIGQTLAMEGVYSFFLESSFLGLFLFGEKSLGRVGHWFAAVAVWAGSWLSGFFIVATDAWMQHPVGYKLGPGGEIQLDSLWGLLLNPWVLWQYPHTMMGALATGSFVMAGIGAFYLLLRRDEKYGRTFVRIGLLGALASSVLLLFPTGDQQGKNVGTPLPRGVVTAIWHRPQFVGQFFMGIVTWPAILQYRAYDEKPDGVGPIFGKIMRPQTEAELNKLQQDGDKRWDLGWIYTVIAGMLNVLVIYDALAGPAFRPPHAQEPKPA